MARLNVKSQNHAQSQKTTERAQNMLDPNVTTEEDIREVPLIVKVYGILCVISGVATLPSIAAFFGSTLLSLVHGNATVHVTDDLWLSVWLVIVVIILSAFFVILESIKPCYFLYDDNANFFLPSYSHNWHSLAENGRIPLINFHQNLGQTFR